MSSLLHGFHLFAHMKFDTCTPWSLAMRKVGPISSSSQPGSASYATCSIFKLTIMDTYQPLILNPEDMSHYLDEEAKDSVSGGLQPSLPCQEQASTPLSIVFALCLVLSVALVCANVWAGLELSASLSSVLPAPDLMQLGRGDQYDGLSDQSRQRRM
ncbi:hypothetical protein BC835DRAFT_1336587 [Cytidiella melzeri]|nr:hypothetical protein BC835DRAFT_1336587 [Cytidiella melzeri]